MIGMELRIRICFGVLDYHGLVVWASCTGTLEGISFTRLGMV